MSIISLRGYTHDYPKEGRIILDSSEILYAHAIQKGRTYVYVKHNVVGKDGEQNPLWIVCEESADNLIEQIEGKEKQTEQRTGEWIHISQAPDLVKGYWAKCSACGHSSFGGGKFCSECGAKMVEEIDTK